MQIALIYDRYTNTITEVENYMLDVAKDIYHIVPFSRNDSKSQNVSKNSDLFIILILVIRIDDTLRIEYKLDDSALERVIISAYKVMMDNFKEKYNIHDTGQMIDNMINKYKSLDTCNDNIWETSNLERINQCPEYTKDIIM